MVLANALYADRNRTLAEGTDAASSRLYAATDSLGMTDEGKADLYATLLESGLTFDTPYKAATERIEVLLNRTRARFG